MAYPCFCFTLCPHNLGKTNQLLIVIEKDTLKKTFLQKKKIHKNYFLLLISPFLLEALYLSGAHVCCLVSSMFISKSIWTNFASKMFWELTLSAFLNFKHLTSAWLNSTPSLVSPLKSTSLTCHNLSFQNLYYLLPLIPLSQVFCTTDVSLNFSYILIWNHPNLPGGHFYSFSSFCKVIPESTHSSRVHFLRIINSGSLSSRLADFQGIYISETYFLWADYFYKVFLLIIYSLFSGAYFVPPGLGWAFPVYRVCTPPPTKLLPC